jgi:steroid 5-alpha reductase family enzyme
MTGLIAAVTAGLSLVMTLAWVVQRRTGNAGWVDAVWSFGLGLAGLTYALAPIPGIAWPGPRQLVVAAAIGLWSLRLGTYLADRSRRGPEDVRYANFRKEWGAAFERNLFGFLQIQALAASLLALSILAAARNPAPLGILDGIGICLIAAAVLGAGIADAQLRRFRADPRNRGRLCDSGLWRLSRHPNYFFEFVGWLAYPCFAIDPGGGYGFGWIAVTAPMLMYWLLVHVSGIPPLELQMLRSRGAAYRDYQARTRPFLPLPLPRRRSP